MDRKRSLFILCLCVFDFVYPVTFDHWNFLDSEKRIFESEKIRSVEKTSWLDHAKDVFGVDSDKDLFKMVVRLKSDRDEAYKLLEKFNDTNDVVHLEDFVFLQDEIEEQKMNDLLDDFSQFRANKSFTYADDDIDFLLDTHDLLKGIKDIIGVSKVDDIEDKIIKLKEELREVTYFFDNLVKFAEKGKSKYISMQY